jgi:hypothetical protein
MTTGFERRRAGARPRTPAAVAAALTISLALAGAPPDADAQEAAPGTVEVDPEAAERALEQTLTAEGALLLPPGSVQIEPSVQYLRRETDDFVVLRNAAGEAVDFAEVEVDRNETTVALDVRLGLPFDTQLELGIPYRFVGSESTRVSGQFGRETTSEDGSGLDDVTVGFAATLVREEAWRPDVIARATWNTATAKETDGDLLLGQSFNEVRGSLTLLKRQDPLAFVGSAFYEKAFEDDGIDPGDSYGFSLSTVLASSPQTSLSFGFQLSFSEDVEIGGRPVPNSGTTQGILTLGASSILGRGLLLTVDVGAGLSEDAPEYFIRVALPFRVPNTLF